MKNAVIKYRLFPNVDKELAFIQKMNQNGYRLVGVFDSFYRFEKTEKTHFTIMRAVPQKEISQTVALAEEHGLTCIPYKFHCPYPL